MDPKREKLFYCKRNEKLFYLQCNINNIRQLEKAKTFIIKKLIGTIIIPIWLIVFIGIVAIVAEILLPDLNGLMVFLFYLVSGLIWIIPIMPIISWMQREN